MQRHGSRVEHDVAVALVDQLEAAVAGPFALVWQQRFTAAQHTAARGVGVRRWGWWCRRRRGRRGWRRRGRGARPRRRRQPVSAQPHVVGEVVAGALDGAADLVGGVSTRPPATNASSTASSNAEGPSRNPIFRRPSGPGSDTPTLQWLRWQWPSSAAPAPWPPSKWR